MLARCFLTLCLLACLAGCGDGDASGGRVQKKLISRRHNEYSYKTPPPQKISVASYPWEEEKDTAYPRITKEFLRCKGSALNPPHICQENGETNRYADCGGSEAHSLPLRDGKEFIYPILLALLNDLQARTGKQVVITSGHRCPAHNSYVDSSKENRYSKHQIGGEVSFYVRDMENTPEKIVALLQKYYRETPKYEGLKEYQEFLRWEKPTDVSTLPWYNKEVFIKLYKKNEGRNLDNRHPHPYLSIQVRYDFDTKERVHYSWDKAFNNFMRW